MPCRWAWQSGGWPALININLLPPQYRRKKESGYWRLVAILVPLVVIATAGTMQYIVQQERNSLDLEVAGLEDRIELLQPYIQEQQELQRRRTELAAILDVANELQRDVVDWTEAIAGVLETLPAGGDAPQIDFSSLSMVSIFPPTSSPDRFEGRPVVAELSVSGQVTGTEVLSRFIRNLEGSPRYGVSFQRTDYQEQEDIYAYSLAIGMHEEDPGGAQ